MTEMGEKCENTVLIQLSYAFTTLNIFFFFHFKNENNLEFDALVLLSAKRYPKHEKYVQELDFVLVYVHQLVENHFHRQYMTPELMYHPVIHKNMNPFEQ